jgi:hypothetical protein
MSKDIREMIDKVNSFKKTDDNPYQIIKEGLNTILDKHTKNGYIIISSYRGGGDKTNQENKLDFESLKKDVINDGFSYIPVYGGFIENIGDEKTQREIKEPSLLIPNYQIASAKPYETDDKLKNLGIVLAKKYNQDSFLFKPKGNDDTAYYIDKNGLIDNTFTGKNINDLTQIYFTDLVKNSYEKGKKSSFGKKIKRYTFTENIYINNSAKDMQEAVKRYGELFFNL